MTHNVAAQQNSGTAIAVIPTGSTSHSKLT
jgi:hypothetical protein